MKTRHLSLFTAFSLMILALAAKAQDCRPPEIGKYPEPILFSQQQELKLAELIDAQEKAGQDVFGLTPIEDEKLSAHLRELGQRLARNLPAGSLLPRFFLIDAPTVNAFSGLGGRIYVTRKLLAFIRNEDELAAVLAHELGHVAVRQSAITASHYWRVVLGVTQIADDAELEDYYNRFLDTWRSKPQLFRDARKKSSLEQLGADRIGMYLLARAGYPPKAMADFWDRFAETKGSTGNLLSELFGTTPPDAKRLREMIKTEAALPPACVALPSLASSAGFEAWRDSVIAWKRTTPGPSRIVGEEHKLSPALRSAITFLKFSADGKYILAQDPASIYVLTREPFANYFRIDAPDADAAQFTPDSKGIVFSNDSLRVETWDIAEQKRTSVHEMALRQSCFEHLLSPDGKVLACASRHRSSDGSLSRGMDLALYDVATQAEILHQDNFIVVSDAVRFESLSLMLRTMLTAARIIEAQFSPDGHYFLAGGWHAHLGFDLSTRTELHLPAIMSRNIQRHFTFLGPGRLLAEDYAKPDKSPLLQFPDGAKISEVRIGDQGMAGAARGDYVLLRPIHNAAVGVLDINSGKVVLSSVEAALDVFDDTCVAQLKTGELELYNMKTKQSVATVGLPPGPIGGLLAATMSPNLKMMALSGRWRGGIFDLSSGRQILALRSFHGAWIEGDVFRGLFPPDKKEQYERAMAAKSADGKNAPKPGAMVGEINLSNGNSREVLTLDSRQTAVQSGPYLLVETPKNGDIFNREVTFEVRDLRSSAVLWSRVIRSSMHAVVDRSSGFMLLAWPLRSEEAKRILNGDPSLAARASKLKNTDYDLLLEVIDLTNGQDKARFVLNTGKGSVQLRSLAVSRGAIVVVDSSNRLHIYSPDGEANDVMFGANPSLSDDGHWLAYQAERGRLVLYDLTGARKQGDQDFATDVVLTSFSQDGKRLAVLTDDQVVHLLNLAALSAHSPTN